MIGADDLGVATETFAGPQGVAAAIAASARLRGELVEYLIG
jgi:hypothetical protein